VDVEQFTSLNQLLENALKTHASKQFSVCMGSTMTYNELDTLSSALGSWLQAQGLEPGARVAIMLPNIPQFAVSMVAILRAGYVCVNVNPLYTPRELAHQLRDSGASAIVILENFASVLQEVVEKTDVKHIVMAAIGDLLGPWRGPWTTFAARHLAKMVPSYKLALSDDLQVTPFMQAVSQKTVSTLKPAQSSLGDTAFLQYTGGTTGLSKGAVLTHRNIAAAILQAEAWFTPALKRLGDISKNNTIAALPLYHIFALTLCLLTMRWGAQLILIPNPRNIGGLIDELKKQPFQVFPGVNTLFNALMTHPQFKTIDFSNLCLSQAGGMAASEGTAKQWFERTGSTMIEGWGMSETCAIGTNNPVTSTHFSGTIGLPLPSIDIAIKTDTGQNAALGESGEICIKGPQVMTGYYQQAEETQKSFTADGYFRTGDIGVMDHNGFFKIIDRKKDMIIVSGFNVFPNELENVISTCPGVVECAAIGIEDQQQGESIKIFVVKDDPTLTEADVAAFCKQQLTGYKRPKYIEFRDDLPKTNVGKILRRELRSETRQ
jgi:acyl-CoA synthetase (AMP-forming)/AMP-acid ligase II